MHGGCSGIYSPIVGSIERGFSARPIYYGMLLAGQFLAGNLLASYLDARGSDVKAYASSASSGLRVVVINRGAAPISIQLKVRKLRGRNAGTIWRLQAPSISSTTGVTVAGASVSPDGLFTPSTTELLAFNEGEGVIHLEPFTAALVVVNGMGSTGSGAQRSRHL